MKKSFVIIICALYAYPSFTQALTFKNNITTAKSSYASGKLEDAHFALQQSMQELDMVIGKEVLKLLHKTLCFCNITHQQCQHK
jgi:hypothetical protein